jgi:hypothetical protein
LLSVFSPLEGVARLGADFDLGARLFQCGFAFLAAGDFGGNTQPMRTTKPGSTGCCSAAGY